MKDRLGRELPDYAVRALEGKSKYGHLVLKRSKMTEEEAFWDHVDAEMLRAKEERFDD